MAELTLRVRLRWFLIVMIGLAASFGLAAGMIWYLKIQGVFGVPREVRGAAPFPVYYVRNVPKPFTISMASYSYNSGVLSFKIDRPDGRSVLITEQSPPPHFDIDDFVAKQVLEPRAVVTTYGKVVLGTSGKGHVASLKTDKTWVLLSAPEGVSLDELSAVAEHLQRQD